MSEAETKIIGGKEFTVTPFLFFKARELENRVLKLALPVIAEIAGSFKEGETDTKEEEEDSISLSNLSFDGGSLSKAVATLFSSLTPVEYHSLLLVIFAGTTCVFEKGDKKVTLELNSDINFDIIFGRHVVVMYKAIAFVAEVNFPDYFGGAALIGSKMKQTLISKLGGANKENE